MSALSQAETFDQLSAEAKEELKEKARQVDEDIRARINEYNELIKDAEKKDNTLRRLQTKGYSVSERFRKALRTKGSDIRPIENELNEIDGEIQTSLNETLDAKSAALFALQSLYRVHIEYLAQAANGLKARCDNLENIVNETKAHEEAEILDTEARSRY